ncbi:MAG: phosphonopyruvate decarboxylase [Alphaproteobacteria bacterium]|jgi:sulfopyruvate decarboxylase TPP-binding subunit|nr:phosphonopyruvate decarboxylase [Alphaproteobacteria bacterium]|tara:strand:- start:75 stop:608 length:534 start_codon:yes stop_codon:yes gene_type:complete
MSDAPAWQGELYDLLREFDVTQFSYVPDAGHKELINRSIADPEVESVSLTTEEEGVALQAGAHLGGAKSVLLMQSSGVGNCVNFFSLIKHGRFPFLTFVSMRGDFGEGNPWQLAMGKATQPVMEDSGITCFRVETEADLIPTARAACTMAYQAEDAIAVLLTQKLLGAKAFSTGGES